MHRLAIGIPKDFHIFGKKFLLKSANFLNLTKLVYLQLYLEKILRPITSLVFFSTNPKLNVESHSRKRLELAIVLFS